MVGATVGVALGRGAVVAAGVGVDDGFAPGVPVGAGVGVTPGFPRGGGVAPPPPPQATSASSAISAPGRNFCMRPSMERQSPHTEGGDTHRFTRRRATGIGVQDAGSPLYDIV